MGVQDLDAILATHPDADHIGGFAAVLGAFSVERVYLNGSAGSTQTWNNFMGAVTAEGSQVTTVSRGDTIPLGGLSLPVHHPGPLSGDTNEDSAVFQLTCGSVDVLFTGDAEIPSETSMLGAGVLSDIDVLKVGHHGSSTSSSQTFLDVVRPEDGVFSAGLESQFGHPHAEVVTRLANMGVTLFYTDTTAGDDSILMTSDCQTYSFNQTPGPGQTPTPTPTTVAPTNTPTETATLGPPTATPTNTTVPPTNTPTATPTQGACGGATATITSLNKITEIVTVNGSGDMTGWYLISLTGNQRYDFPNGFNLSGTVTIHSATAQFTDTPTDLWWTGANLWNNSSNDDAALFNCNDQQVSFFDDGS